MSERTGTGPNPRSDGERSLFDALPTEVQTALREARHIAELWFAEELSDAEVASLAEALDDLGVHA